MYVLTGVHLIISKTLVTDWEACTAILLCVCRAIVILPEDGHFEAVETQSSCKYVIWLSFSYTPFGITTTVTVKPAIVLLPEDGHL